MTLISRRRQSLKAAMPMILGATLFLLGLAALYHLLRSTHPADIAAQIRAIPVSILLASLGATAVSYAALVVYDAYALRFIGRQLSTGVVALGGFLGSAFGNTIGISVVSGGAVRYRIYSAAGLNAFEVAAMSGYVAVALGAGLTLYGLAALAVHPGAIAAYLPYAAGTVRMVAAATVLIVLAAAFWFSQQRRSLRIRSLELHLPAPADLVGQLLVTLVDIVGAAFALWILLPAGKPDFAAFVAIYAAATMIGVLSHVPGGIGVFETIVIGALPSGVAVGDAAAALLLFRLVYFLVPFALGFLLVSLNEARAANGLAKRLFARVPALQPVLGTLHGLSPGLVAVVTVGFGAYLLLVAMIPSVRTEAIAEHDLAGAILLEGGTFASAIAGLALLILSHGLARRVSAAYWFTIAAFATGVVALLLNDLDVTNALLLALGALALLPFRRAFDRPGRLTQGIFEPRWFATVVGVAIATLALFFFVHKAVPYSNDLWTEFSAGSGAPRALRAGLAASALLFFFGLYLLTRPIRQRLPLDDDPEDRARAAALAATAEDPQAWLSQTGDKRFLFSATGDAYIMYGVQGGSWIALGDPVGTGEDIEALCWTFSELASKANCRPVFYEVSARRLPLWIELGMVLNKIGEEAVIDLPSFSLAGSQFKSMRAAQNKRQREGYSVELLSAPHEPAIHARLEEISTAWLDGKTGREKGFSVGRFDRAYLDLFDIAVVKKDSAIVAFANILSCAGGRYISVDLMRYLPSEASGLMEYLFLSLIQLYKERGAEEFSLGMAPLAGLSEQSVGRSWNRFGRLIYRHGGAFYNFEGLRAFKQKFRPDWRPRYLALPPGSSPLVAMGDAALLIAGSARSLLGK